MTTEVLEALVRYVQNNLTKDVQSTDDKTLAISCAALFRAWEPGKYEVGDIRTDEGIPYECILTHNSIGNPDWDISVRTLWKPYHSREEKWALPYIQPTGAHDAYQSGEYMVWIDDNIYRSKTDSNVYTPDNYPAYWELVE